jgi:hypothetical protein
MPGLLLLSGRSSSKSPTRSGEFATACESQRVFPLELRIDLQTYLDELKDFGIEVLPLGDIYDGVIAKQLGDPVDEEAKTI